MYLHSGGSKINLVYTMNTLNSMLDVNFGDMAVEVECSAKNYTFFLLQLEPDTKVEMHPCITTYRQHCCN